MPGQALIEPPDSVPASVPGWFGKVVMLGDFAQRRLSQGFVGVCDAWLSQGIGASRAQLGQQWLETYLGAPIWGFAWAPGVVDDRWWFGVMMPSVDAVGRYFPLIVATSDQNPPMSTDTLNLLSNWYRQVSQTALATLEAGASLDRFESELAQIRPWQEAPTPADAGLPLAAEQRRLALPGSPTLAEWAQVLAGPVVVQRYAAHTFWLPLAAEGGGSSLTVCPGLPPPDQFSLMLEGRW